MLFLMGALDALDHKGLEFFFPSGDICRASVLGALLMTLLVEFIAKALDHQ